ncbi:hypothetical protein BJY01DRAFT_255790 [Aspergillus pseudoustus]|uniref:Uncharacterized protein n=1 Tax=Aspergillus pseudoustus TaxID=1810923 RepID=A0ABR4IHB6_9EURO
MAPAPTLYDLTIAPPLNGASNIPTEKCMLFLTPAYPLPSHESATTLYTTKPIPQRRTRYETCIETCSKSDSSRMDVPRGRTVITTITLEQKKVFNEVVLSVKPCEPAGWLIKVLGALERKGVVSRGTARQVGFTMGSAPRDEVRFTQEEEAWFAGGMAPPKDSREEDFVCSSREWGGI